MEKVSIDVFVVPEESKQAFLERARIVQSLLKSLPGFVEGFIYEKRDGQSPWNFVTTAVWKNEEAFENAKKAVAAEFQRQGFNFQEMTTRLRIESVRATYDRSPY
jgi:heme-degrading monooxygenase HmoA